MDPVPSREMTHQEPVTSTSGLPHPLRHLFVALNRHLSRRSVEAYVHRSRENAPASACRRPQPDAPEHYRGRGTSEHPRRSRSPQAIRRGPQPRRYPVGADRGQGAKGDSLDAVTPRVPGALLIHDHHVLQSAPSARSDGVYCRPMVAYILKKGQGPVGPEVY